jgi:DNA polymerase III alpha subunit
MSGGIVHPPHANHSELLTRLYGIDLFLGFIHVKGLEKHWMQAIPEERLQNGAYCSLFDFVSRLKIPLEQLNILIQVGALRFTEQTKKDMLRQAPLLYAPQRKEQMGLPQLFVTPNKQFTLPGAADSPIEDAFDELNLLGFPVSLTMFDLLHPQYQRQSIVAQEQLQFVGKRVAIVGQLVTYKTIRTRKGLPMVFGTLIDREGNFFDTTHFPESLQKYQFKGEGLYYIEGKMIEEFGVPSIEVHYLERLPFRTDPRFEDIRMRLAG